MASILIYILVICIVIGVAYYLISNFLPEPASGASRSSSSSSRSCSSTSS
jgi:uncharacterized protein (UPF0333 family)